MYRFGGKVGNKAGTQHADGKQSVVSQPLQQAGDVRLNTRWDPLLPQSGQQLGKQGCCRVLRTRI